jgi:hypothetical protein
MSGPDPGSRLARRWRDRSISIGAASVVVALILVLVSIAFGACRLMSERPSAVADGVVTIPARLSGSVATRLRTEGSPPSLLLHHTVEAPAGSALQLVLAGADFHPEISLPLNDRSGAPHGPRRPSNVARKPSPAVSISTPSNRSARTDPTALGDPR